MVQAMLAGVASIRAQQTRMNVIGNNLANVNTTAYKSSRITFQEMMAQTIRGASGPSGTIGGRNAFQYGLGVQIGATDTNVEQGSLQATNRPTDLSIQGNGYFVVSDGAGMSYTRDGAMSLDANGDLVHASTGQRMVGWSASGTTGVIDNTQPLSASNFINIPLGLRTTVQETGKSDFNGNLESSAAVGTTTESTVQMFDSLGNSHNVKLVFTKSATNQWTWAASSVDGEATVTGTGTIDFNTNGAVSGGGTGSISVTAAGASPMTVSADFSKVTQMNAKSAVQGVTDGTPAGSLSGFTIGADGVITGLYTNGLSRPIAQITTATFQNTNGLERLGSNLWRQTPNSGSAELGEPTVDGRGAVVAGFLEQSNVDIGQEFTDLIITQRGFQANTKIVTTVDEMLQDLIGMKR